MSVVSHPAEHDFRTEDWWGRRDCARQRALRNIAPMPFGAVPIVRDDMDESEVRKHFRWMNELGFNSIKQFMTCPRWPVQTLERMALEEGLCPWWYGEGGWEGMTPELCAKLGLDPADTPADLRNDPRMQDHQRQVWASRIGYERIKMNPEQQAGFHDNGKQERPGAKAFGADALLPDWAVPHFVAWLKSAYEDDLSLLNEAWNTDVMRGPNKGAYRSWEEVETNPWVEEAREYGRVRDVLRFKAAMKAEEVSALCQKSRERDPWEPNRVGGEMGIFLPFASRGTDMELLADAIKETGSFYPSIHLCWHFEETEFEVARPVYMQASMMVDWNKGGWTAPWESTGGPQQTSGAKAMLYPAMAEEQPGFTVDEGVMTQLLLSYLAAGCKGAGLWSWNARLAGFEGGEYALLDRNEQVCERTRRVGAIANAANHYRDELWASLKEPQVGILVDFDNEAIWAAMSQRMRTLFKYRGVEGRIGAARACMQASIPFEHITGRDLEAGLAARYPVIFLPSFLGLKRSHLPLLTEYVKQGGRLVMDMPGGCYDERGRVLWTRQGTPFEQLFGCELSDLQYSGNNVDWSIEGMNLFGYTADLTPTTAKVQACYEHGKPAITENSIGKGSAVLLGWEAARACTKPGNAEAEDRLATLLLGGAEPFYRCEGPPVCYRLSGPDADHYFLVNEGEASEARFTRLPYAYATALDVLEGKEVDLSAPLPIGKDNGLWIRAGK